MEKIINRCKKSILFYTVIYIIIFILSRKLLNTMGMQYRQNVNYLSIILILIGIISGVTQIFMTSKSKSLKICIIIFAILIVGIMLLISPIILLSIALLPPEHIVGKEDKKYVAYVYSWHDTRVEYYDYINFLLMGNVERIEEFYHNVSRDVLAKDAKELFTPTYTNYYDINGTYQHTIRDKSTKNTQEIQNIDETIYNSEYLKKYEKDFNTLAINGFITSTNAYTKPNEMNLEQVFYNGAGFDNEVSTEELEEYKKLTRYHGTDIVKITTEQAETLYHQHTGEKLENLKKRLKNWIYIEKYDAYYHEISDTNFETISCIKGIMNEQSKIMKIQLSNNRTISIKIDTEKGTHYIISNESTN